MAMTRASRNIGLRTFYDPLNPPTAKPQPIPPSLVPRPIDGGFGWDPVHPAYSPGGGVDMTPVSGNRELSAMSPPPPISGNPQLSAMSPPPNPAGSPEMQAWGGGVPLPPVRPAGLGGVLAGAVAPASVPYPPSRPTDPAAAPAAPSPFTLLTAPNSDPTARNRPQMSALDLSGLLGGLFGGRR